MLVLSRKRDERIVIGDNIVITVVEVRGDKVRLGIEAPTEVPVHRQEVLDAMRARVAAQGAARPPVDFARPVFSLVRSRWLVFGCAAVRLRLAGNSSGCGDTLGAKRCVLGR